MSGFAGFGQQPGPDLASLLGGPSGPPGPAGPGGPGDVSPPGDQHDSKDPQTILDEILQLLTEYRSVETDQEDLLLVEKASTLVQQVQAGIQKANNAAMGGKMDARHMQRIQPGY